MKQLRWTANWCTAFRVVCIPPMIWNILCGDFTSAMGWFGINQILDIWDGLIARRQGGVLTDQQAEGKSLWEVMNFPGVTPLGSWMDPVMDKATNGVAILLLGLGFVPWPLVVLPVLIDLLLQFGVRPLKKWLKIGDDASNGNGKAKNWLQSAAIVWLALGRGFWWGQWVAIGYLMLAIIYGGLSVYGHLWPKKANAPRPFQKLT